MKKIFFIAIILMGLTELKSQITINQSHMPKSGDTLRFTLAALDTSVLLNFQNSGSNLSWDFSSLTPQRQGVRQFLNSSQTPYSGDVSNRIGEKLADTLEIGGVNIFDVYDFFDSDINSFSLDHRGASVPTGLPAPLPTKFSFAPAFSDPDEIYQFPLDYLDRDSSNFKVVFNNPLAYYESSGFRINEVDAWGTIITPYDTFNTIRVVTDIVSFDSVDFAGNSVGVNSHRREYKWLSRELKVPALTINGAVVNGLFVPAAVQYRDTVRNVPTIFAPTALFVADDLSPEVNKDTVNITNLSFSLLPANFRWEVTPSTFTYINGTSATSDSLALTFQDTGFYDVQLIAINSSGRDSLKFFDYIRARLITSLPQLDQETIEKIKVFPNPLSSQEHIQLQIPPSLSLQQIEIYSLSGKLIKSIQKNAGQAIVFIKPPTTKGVYFLKIETEEGFGLKKIIIQ